MSSSQLKAFKRDKKNKTAQMPKISDTVNSVHFNKGSPSSAANPVATLHLDSDKELQKLTSDVFRQAQKKRK